MIQAGSYLLWPMVCLVALVTVGCDTALDPKFYAKRADAKPIKNDNDKSTQLTNLDTNTDLNIQETPKESPKKTRTRVTLEVNNGTKTRKTNGDAPPVKIPTVEGSTTQPKDLNQTLAELAKKVGDPAAAEKLREMIKDDPEAAGVGKRPGGELVDKIIAAIGKNNTPVAHQALRDLLAGELKTQKPDKDVVDQTLKAISDNIKGPQGPNKEIENLLLDAVTSPDRFRVVATQGSMTAKELQYKAFARFKLLSKDKPELLAKLAERIGEASLSEKKLKEVIDFLLWGNQLGPKWALYLSKAISSQQQALIAEDISGQSSAALQKMYGLKVLITKPKAVGKGLSPASGGQNVRRMTIEKAYRTAKVLWAKESSAKLLARFSKTTDIRSDPVALKLAATMPLSLVRSELGSYLRLVGQKSGPNQLVQLGVFDWYMPDPALLVLMKPIWHPKKKRDGASGDSPPSQWANAASTLLHSLNSRFKDRASSPDDGAPSLRLHSAKASSPKAKDSSVPTRAVKHFKLSWPSVDAQNKLPGIDLARLNVHYILIEENMTDKLALGVIKHYLNLGKDSFERPLTDDRVGSHVDDYYKTATRKLRSVDVLVYRNKPTNADIAAAAQKEAAAKQAVDNIGQLKTKLKNKYKRASDLTTEIGNIRKDLAKQFKDLSSGKFNNNLNELKKKRTEYANKQKDAVNKQKEFQKIQTKVRQQIAQATKTGRDALGAARNPGSLKFYIEILIIEIDDPRKSG